MFGFSMIQMVRRHDAKLDRSLRESLVNLYRPFRWTPCFLHRMFESGIKKFRSFPVIVEFADGEAFEMGMPDIHHIMAQYSRCQLKHHLPSVNCCAADLTPDAMEHLLDNCCHIRKIHFDREVRALLDVAKPSIFSDKAKNPMTNSSLTGKGVTIAIVDTGIYPHPDLRDRITGFKDFIGNQTQAYDDNGHGTHCAGDAAGGGKYAGPAPDAHLIGVKVLDQYGSGSLSTVMAGIQWCIDNKSTKNIDIISMSLGSSPAGKTEGDLMVEAVNKAWEAGIVVCVAAGNEGSKNGTISSPGTSELVITVGAINDRNTTDPANDIIADFSSRGPTLEGNIKPDIVAPGVNIISLRSPNSYLDKWQKSSRREQNYFELSGTSMATPICAGAVAQLLELRELNPSPNLSPDEIKDILMVSATHLGGNYPNNTYGAGYLNLEAAVNEAMSRISIPES